jgi:hypothetical protein
MAGLESAGLCTESVHEPVKYGVIRRAAFQKPGRAPILMKKQRNFDFAAGFFQPLLSDRFP